MGLRAAAILLLVTVAPCPAVADGWLGAALGGGWDSNVNLGVAGAPTIAAGFATVHASAGVASGSTRKDESSLELAYEATLFPEYPDLALHRPSLTVAWSAGDVARLRLSAFAGWRAAADPARAGWDAGAAASVRRRLGPTTTLRGSAGYARREAEEAAFDGSTWRAQAGIELRLGPGVVLWAELQSEAGTVSITRLPTSTDSASSRRTTDSYGTSLQPSTATVFTHGGAAGLWIPLGERFSLSASYRQGWLFGTGIDGERALATLDLAWSI